jgi:putative transposase
VVLENSDLSERMKVTPIAFSLAMLNVLSTLLAALRSILRSRAALELENLALRHQIGVLRRSAKRRAKLTSLDRLFWSWLSHIWCDWRSALTIVQPETVIAWHRRGFGLFWAWKIRRGQPGRPTLAYEVRELIRRMCRENPTWGTVVPASPRITQFWSKVRILW